MQGLADTRAGAMRSDPAQPVLARAATPGTGAARTRAGDRLGAGSGAVAAAPAGPACATAGVPGGWYFPCPGWQFADSFLASALGPNPNQDEATRELPVVRPRLPRREPGAHLQEEARFDGWFTQPG